MIDRRFVVFAFSAAVGFGFALHELPKQHAPMAATSVTVHIAR